MPTSGLSPGPWIRSVRPWPIPDVPAEFSISVSMATIQPHESLPSLTAGAAAAVSSMATLGFFAAARSLTSSAGIGHGQYWRITILAEDCGRWDNLRLLREPIRVSDRRWRSGGLWRTLWIWFVIQALYLAGVTPTSACKAISTHPVGSNQAFPDERSFRACRTRSTCS